MNPNQMQALEEEQAGEEELDEEIDFDSLYGAIDINVDTSEAPKTPEMQKSYAEIFGDVGKQFAKETLVGFGSLYGTLADLVGVKPEGLPNQEQLRGAVESLGGPGEAETEPGKAAGRIGNLYGSGLVFGQTNPVPAIAAGGAGFATELLGGGALAQAAAEIVALLATKKPGKPSQVSSRKPEVTKKIDEMRKLGYTEEDITLAINSAYQDSKAVQMANKGANTKQAFDDFANHSDEIVKGIFSSEIPGIEQGTKHVHQMASQAYGSVVDQAANLKIKNLDPFFDAMHKTVKDVKKILGNNKDAKDFIVELTENTMDVIDTPTVESMIDFYKRLNKVGRWVGKDAKDRIITQVKDSIKDTFRSEGKAGKELADQFEKVNAGIQKAYKAEAAHKLMQGTKVKGKIDFNKFEKLWDNPKNVEVFTEALGPTQTGNLKRISQIGNQVKNFDKSWKTTKGISSLQNAGVLYYLLQGDFASVAKIAASKAGGGIVANLAERSITDPKMQNLMIRGLHAVKSESPKMLKSVEEGLRKYLKDEGIEDLEELEIDL